jgi:formylmethanofuran dehydrogenase subunit E
MEELKSAAVVPDWLVEFHGHLCPFLVVGWRMGQEALQHLGAEREKDQGLWLFTELGSDRLRAQSCYEDGLQAATGCTAGKGTLRRLDFGKVAAVLARPSGPALRIALRPEICDALAGASYAAERMQGTPASRVSAAAIADAVDRIARLDPHELFSFEQIDVVSFRPVPGEMARARCESCGEYVFRDEAVERDGKTVCRPCAGLTQPL